MASISAIGTRRVILGDFKLPGEGVHNLVDILGPEAVLVAVPDQTLAGVNHVDAFACSRPLFLVQHDDTGGDAGVVKQIGRQAK